MALPAGWYPVTGDPAGTHRYWDGDDFTTGPKRDEGRRRRAGFLKPNGVTKWNMATPMARGTSALIDYGAPIVIVVGIANGLGVEIPANSVAGWTGEPRLVGAILACYFINQVLLVGLFGVSLGRTLLGLRVVNATDKDRAPGLMRAFIRFALQLPGLPLTLLFFLLGRRQGLHDLAAGTAVIYA